MAREEHLFVSKKGGHAPVLLLLQFGEKIAGFYHFTLILITQAHSFAQLLLGIPSALGAETILAGS